MKTLKIMSVIGIILFSFILIVLIENHDIYGMGGIMYGIAISVVGLVQANKSLKDSNGN